MPATDLLRGAVRSALSILLFCAACVTGPAPVANDLPGADSKPAAAAPVAPAPIDLCQALGPDSTAQLAHIPAGAMEEEPPKLRLPEDARPTQEALSLTVDPNQPRFSGVAAIALQLDKPRSAIWLHGQGLTVSDAHLDLQGARLPVVYQQINDRGLVKVKFPCVVSGRALLSISWDAPFDPHLAGLYIAHEKDIAYAYTQFEAIDARRAFPAFDEPAFKIPWDVELVVPAEDVAISNGSISAESPSENGMHRVRFNTTPPLPSYLLAFAVGPFDVVVPPPMPPSAIRNHPLQLRGIAPKGRGPELKFALEGTAALMTRLEEYFAIPYPFEKLDQIAVPDFSYGAMENAGAITYRENDLLFKPGTSSRRDEQQVALVMAHEMAHQWFGDLVTPIWWTDAWLNESFAAWMEYKMVDEWRPELRGGIDAFAASHRVMEADATSTARAIRKPVEDEASIWNQFDALTYSKGAGLLAMIESFVGKEPLRLGIQSYLRAHANGSGSSDDLFAAISTASGRDITGSMRSFLDQAGIPLVRTKLNCSGKVRLELEQSRALKIGAEVTPAIKAERWQIPICARASVHGEIRTACTLLTEEKGELELGGTRCPDWVMPDMNGRGYYRYAPAAADLQALVAARARLSPLERASLASNLGAAYDEGTLPPDEVIRELTFFARDPEPEVSAVLAGVLTDAREDVISRKLRPELEAYARSVYLPLAKKLGWSAAPNESPEAHAQRNEVLYFLTMVARDPEARSEGAKLGLAYANLDGESFDGNAVSPDLAELALALAVQEGGAPVRQKLIARFANSSDQAVRRRILNSLGSNRDPDVTQSLLQLTFDPQMHKNERGRLIFFQLRNEETRAQASIWLTAHWDTLVADQGADSMAGYFRMVAGVGCTREDVAAAEAFLRPKLEKMPNAALSLEQGLEGARLCIARREADQKNLDAFFFKRIKDAPTR